MGTTRRNKPKIIAIVGQTATGKSDLAIYLAKKFNGEVVSADSRQVYKGLDIGTGKVTKEEMQGIKHYLLDVASPKRIFDVVQFQKKAHEAISKILKKGKVPIICGGTGLYIDAITKNIQFPKTKKDWNLRKKLETKSIDELFEILKKLDPKRAKNIDKKNKRRLIRAIEIIKTTNKPIEKLKENPIYDVLYIGIKKEKDELKKLIEKRLKKRIKEGMIEEAKKLQEKGLTLKRMKDLGLEYKYLALFLEGKINKKEMIEELSKKINQYAKRQLTWFKKNKDIHWIKNKKEAEKLTKNFLKNN